MGLRYAHKGYRYQDFFAARIVLAEMLKQGNPVIRIDEKETGSDIVDDIKIVGSEKKVCYQIKHTTTSRTLSWQDIADGGQLDIPKLFKHYQQEKTSVEYVFILKWGIPSKSDAIFQYLSAESVTPFDGAVSYKINSGKITEIEKIFKLVSATDFLQNLRFICNAPAASLDIMIPETLENNLLNMAKRLGLGAFPNQKQTPENFIIRLVDELTNKRSATVYEITINDLLKKLGVVTDFGSIPQVFQINEEIFLSQKGIVDSLIKEFEKESKIILIGDPGAGKSYIVNDLIKNLESADVKYAHHYFFIGNNDDLAVTRIEINTLIGNILNEIYAHFPEIRKENDGSLAATIETLNNAISKINESFYLIIDGVDHAYRNYYRTPEQKGVIEAISAIALSGNIKLLFVSQPLSQMDAIYGAKIINVPSWDNTQIVDFTQKFGLTLSETEVQKIADVSKGNPLYLTYIFSTLRQSAGIAIDELPQYGGNITNYYEYLIKKIDDNELFELISVVPFLFESDEMAEISNRGTFVDGKLNELRPILRYDKLRGGFCVYHESLRRFIYDHCAKNKIDLNQSKQKVLTWLKSKDFFENHKAFRNTLMLAYELGEYEFVASHIGYDFLKSSMLFGHSQKSVLVNLSTIKQAICKTEDYVKLSTFMLVKMMLLQHRDQDFLTSNEPEFFQAYISLYGQTGVNDLIYKREMDSKSMNELLYNVSIMGYSIPWDFVDKDVQYLEYEDDILSKLYCRKMLLDNRKPKKGIEKCSIDDFKYLLEQALLVGNEQIIFDALEATDKSNNLKLFVNAFGLSKRYSLKVDFDTEAEFDEKERHSIYKRIIDFISFCDNNLSDISFCTKLKDRASTGFIWAFFKYVFDVKTTIAKYEKHNQMDLFEDELIQNLRDFAEISKPFNGSPRACDLTEPIFRSILRAQLFNTMKRIADVEKQVTFLSEILSLHNNIASSFRGSKSGCLLFFEIMDSAANMVNENNYRFFADLFDKQIEDEKNYSHYNYIESYLFKMAFIVQPYDPEKASNYYLQGIEYSLAYGWRRDVFLYEVLNSFDHIKADIDYPAAIYTELGNMSFAMDAHTDGKDTKHLPVEWFKKLFKFDKNGALEFLTTWQLGHQYDWRANDMREEVLEGIRNLVSDEVYYFALITSQFENHGFDYSIYIEFATELLTKGKKDLAQKTLAYLCGLPVCEICKKEDFILSIKELAKKLEMNVPDFVCEKAEPSHSVDRDEVASKEYKLDDFKKGFLQARNCTPQSIIDTIKSVDYNESNRQKIIVLFKESIRFDDKAEKYIELIEKTNIDDPKKVFLYVCCFATLSDGWFQQFYFSKCFVKAIAIDADLAKSYFFEIIANDFDLDRGVDNLIKALLEINCERTLVTNMWEQVLKFARLRILNTPNFAQEHNLLSAESLEVQASKMIVSMLCDFASDNHRRIMRFISEVALGSAELEKPIMELVLSNWHKINATTKFELLSLLISKKIDLTAYKKECSVALELDDNIFSKMLLSELIKVKNKNLSIDVPVDYVGLDDISDGVVEYCCAYLFNYHLLAQFCGYFEIDKRKILSKYIELRHSEEAKEIGNSFYSNYYKRFMDNYLPYDLYLKSINCAIREAFFQKLINKSDIISLALEILPDAYLVVVDTNDAIIKSDEFVVIAAYNASDDAIEQDIGKANKIVKYEIATVGKVPIVTHNLDDLKNCSSYNRQIMFEIDPVMKIMLGLSYCVVGGQLCMRNYSGNTIVKYIVNKTNMHSVRYMHDKYYTSEQGFLLIEKKAFDNWKKFVGERAHTMISKEFTLG